VTLTALRDDALSSAETGFALRLSLPWIRSLPLAGLDGLEVAIDGTHVDPLTIELAGRAVDPAALAQERVWWFIQDRVVVRGDRMLSPGAHEIAVSFRLVVPYLQAGPDGPLALPFDMERTLVLDDVASAPTVSRDVA
jgi:hypothetical protein